MLWVNLPTGTPLYRVTRDEDTWDEVLKGLGAFYNEGGRYNRIHQQTVYTSEDPLVALSEYAWHEAFSWCSKLRESVPLIYPLAKTAKFWRFQINSDLQLVDIGTPEASQYFDFPAHMPLNCNPIHNQNERDRPIVSASHSVADRVRNLRHPSGSTLRSEGLVAPSVRTPHSKNYQPQQVVLFVIPTHGAFTSLQQQATLLDEWLLELEFLTPDQLRVTASEKYVAWMSPRFQLSGNTAAVPRYPKRPNSKAISVNKWHTLNIQYSPY